MSDYARPKTQAGFEQNFSQLKPLMNDTEAAYESSRCLFCFDAPCVNACPSGIDIPLFIRQINTGNLTGAAATIYGANYLGNTCGKVCPTEVLCEGACVYNHQKVRPVDIGRLQTYASTHAIENKLKLFRPGEPIGVKVAVLGAGPAGLACAAELRRAGCEVVVYEKQAKPSGLALYGVAPYKITNELALQEAEWLTSQLGFEIKYNQAIDGPAELELLEAGFDFIFIGIGLGKTRSIKVQNENLQQVYGAAEWIANLRIQQHAVEPGKKVIVIGGGNTAMDAASECVRLGSPQVILAYRGDKSEMSAYEFEYYLARHTGVKSLFNVQPVEFMGLTKVTGVKFIRTRRENGKLVTIEGSEFLEPCDMVIRATGQEKQVSVFQHITGLETDASGKIKTDEWGQTTHPKYFAAGDCANGGKEIVNAVAEGKKAARGILNSVRKNIASGK